MTVYENIQEIAKEHGLTIKEVAKKAEIGENSIYRWQKSTPSIKSLQKVANVLHVTVEDLTVNDDLETPEYRAIQRKAERLNPQQQEKLLKMMDITFDEEFNDTDNK